MNLVSLLILPAVINLQDNDPVRYAVAGVALAVLVGAIAFSKRRTQGLDEGTEAVPAQDVMDDKKAALQAAIDRWIYDLGDEEADLREHLRAVRGEIETTKT
jgi:hypothetical protein